MSKLIARATTIAIVALVPAAALADPVVASAVDSPAVGTQPVLPPTDSPKAFETQAPPAYDQPDQVLLPGKATHGGFGAPEVKLTALAGDAALLVGGQGGWIINHGFVIGGAGYGLATSLDAPEAMSVYGTRSTLQFGYGGPRLSYVIRPHDVVHFTVGLLVGGGGYGILSRNDSTDQQYVHHARSFFVTEPGAELEANVLRWMRVGFGASFRYVAIRAVPGIDAGDLSGPAASLVVKLGVF